MEFTRLGFDVYTSEVDNRGIDFVIRKSGDRYYDMQVKSLRYPGTKYIFFPKNKFEPRENLFAAVVLFSNDEPPLLYLIPAMAWCKPSAIFLEHKYEGKKSKPEWGLNLSQCNLQLLEKFVFSEVAKKL